MTNTTNTTNITIVMQNTKWEKISEFLAQDKKSIAQCAKENETDIPIACKAGMCGICKAKILQGKKLIQIDKISMPMKALEMDQNGNPEEVFTCLAGIKSKFFNDGNSYEIILEKDI